LHQVRETLVSAGNATFSDAERAGLAGRLAGLREQLLSVANRSDGAGSYLFGGQGASQPPFVDAPGGVAYRGVAGQLQSGGDEPLPLTADGQGAWLNARTGNGVFETRSLGSTTSWIDGGQVNDATQLTGGSYRLQFGVSAGVTTFTVLRDGAATALTNQPYKSGEVIAIDGLSFTVHGAPADGDSFEAVPSAGSLSVFDTLDRAIAELRTSLRTVAQIAQGNASALRDIDNSFAALQTLRAGIGETLNRTDAVETRLAEAKLAGQTERSNAEDMDMVEAISTFQNRQTGYDAALKTYSMVQRLSLFQYLNL
jgi:flagellar hook-associated protein 3 FlgL